VLGSSSERRWFYQGRKNMSLQGSSAEIDEPEMPFGYAIWTDPL